LPDGLVMVLGEMEVLYASFLSMILDQYRTVELPARPDARLMASICRWKDCVSMVIVVFTTRILHRPGSSDNPLSDILRLDGVLTTVLGKRIRHLA
jgi:hypothetical protein